jgi:excisionase family DNA binding protein
MPDEVLVLTVPEAARLLGIGRGLAYEAVARGEIPSVRIGRRIVVPRYALDALLRPNNETDSLNGPGQSNSPDIGGLHER